MWTCLFVLGGCVGLETVTELPKQPRRPDGVVIDPPPAMPIAADRSNADGVIALREPIGDKDVEDVVRAYVRGFEREDLESLRQLLTADAVPLGRAGNRAEMLRLWADKMKNFEYGRLAGTEIVRISQIEKYGFDAFGRPGGSRRPQEMRPGDLYVQVPIAVPRVGSEQLFGAVLALLLRREDGRLKIAGQADEAGN